MPIYEYKCNTCDKTFETMQKINAEPLTKCMYCQGDVEKLISRSSFQLKGSGWYVSDYKNKARKTDTSSKSAASVKENVAV